MLNTLTVKNYRLFENFQIDQLARVNLIVGNNNSGKSSLLEALHLLTSEDVRSSFLFILTERGEFVSRSTGPRATGLRNRLDTEGYQISHLFHGRASDIGKFLDVRSDNQLLRMSVQETRRVHNLELRQLSFMEELQISHDEVESDELAASLIFERRKNGTAPDIESMRIEDDGFVALPSSYQSRRKPSTTSRLITTNYLDYNELAVLWDRITLTPKEDNVVEALQILEPQVERISFTSRQTSSSGILIKLNGEAEPIPLGSLGDGMRRVLTIAASLVSVNDGTLLVDEIDTGLYYGVLADTWRLILETAAKQNAQVFATTHSWDCVKAFQQALRESGNEQMGQLIRLDSHDHKIVPVCYSSQELDIAIQQGIEVR